MGQHGVQGHAPRLPVAIPAPACGADGGACSLCILPDRGRGQLAAITWQRVGPRPGWGGCVVIGRPMAAVLHYPPVTQGDDAIRMACHRHVVGHQNDGVALGVQLLEDGHHLFAALAVESAGGFVRQDHLAAVGERPGNTDPLLLTAGELAGSVVAAILQSQAGQQGAGSGLAIKAGSAGIDGGDLHVGGRVQMGQQVIALEDEAEVVAAQPCQGEGIQGRGILAAKQILAAARAIEAAQQVHQGRFAGAGGADDGHHLPGIDG